MDTEQRDEPTPDKPKATKERKVAQLFGLEGENWMRHANPISVWTRFSVLSLMALSIWSREWIGWYCLIPIALSVIWMMVNPLLFKEPKSTKNWASKAVLGERIYSDRTAVEIPEQFRSRVPNVANAVLHHRNGLAGVWARGSRRSGCNRRHRDRSRGQALVSGSHGAVI